MTYRIYSLTDPTTNELMYIGKTIDLLHRRLSNHIYKANSNRDQTPKGHWIRKLLENKQRPIIKELYLSSNNDWQIQERKWIKSLKPLLNLCKGGNGSGVRVKLTTEIINQLGQRSDTSIAKELSCSRENVCYHRRRLGIDSAKQDCSNRPKPIGRACMNLPREIIQQLGKVSASILAKEAGCSTTTINSNCKRLGIPVFTQVPFKGELHGSSKFEEKDIKQIRQMFSDGIKRKEIAKYFGLDYTNICDIINNKTWRHI